MAERAPALLWVTDRHGDCTWCNEALVAFTGRPDSDLTGDGWLASVHPDDVAELLGACRTASESIRMECRLQRHDGDERCFLIGGAPRLAPDGKVLDMVITAVDITEHRHELDRSRRSEREKHSVAELGRAALQGGKVPDLLDTAGQQALGDIDATVVEILELGAPEPVLRSRAAAEDDPTGGHVVTADLALFTIANDAPVLSDVDSEQRFDRSQLVAARMASSVAVVIRTNRGPFGVLAAASRLPNAFDVTDAIFLRNVANVLGAAITRDRIEAELELRELENNLAYAVGRVGTWRWEPATGRVWWSAELERIHGMDPGSFGGSFEDFEATVHPDDRSTMMGIIREAARTGHEFSSEHRAMCTDGTTRLIDARGARFETGDGREHWIGVAIDVTDLREVERARLHALEAEHAAREELQEAYRQLEETVARLDALLQHAPIGFAFFDEELRFVGLNQAAAEMTGSPTTALLGKRMADAVPGLWSRLGAWLGQVLETGEPLVDIEISGQPSATEDVERHWLAGYYPVRTADGRPFGLGNVIVEITERKRQEREARLVAEASELHAAPSDLDSTLDRAVSIAVPEFCDSCSIHVSVRAGIAAKASFAHRDEALAAGMWDADRDNPVAVEQLLVLTGPSDRAALIEDLSAETARRLIGDDPATAGLVGSHRSRSLIVAPLQTSGRTIGVMTFSTMAGSGRRLQESDRVTAQEVAGRLAHAIDAAYLRREAMKAESRLDLLAQAGQILTVDLSSEARLRAVADVAVPTFADAAAVFLGAGHDMLELAAFASSDDAFGADDVELAGSIPVSASGPVGAAFRRREPMLVASVDPDQFERTLADPAVVEVARRSGINSLLAVPLVAGGEALGVAVFCLTVSGRRYAPEDVALAQELARRLAAAVEDALRFEQQSEAAEILQRSLLPESLPFLRDAGMAARYLPGASGIKVGGDWYDAIPLEGGRVVLAIGDVVGHGVAAAASMGRARNALQLCALEGMRPSEMLERLNRYFCSLNADMATVLVAIFDAQTRSLCYANAGHLPPVVRAPDGSTTLLEDAGGLPMCAVDDAEYCEAEYQLEPGSTLVLYTDGLVERRGESLDAGLARLSEVLATGGHDPEPLTDRLVAEVLGDAVRSDDVALLVLEVHPPSDDLQLGFTASPRELADVRRTVDTWLQRMGAAQTTREDIVVAVNEIAANSIEHAYGLGAAEVSLHAQRTSDGVEITVRDKGSWRGSGPRADRGRGLTLARSLVDHIDIDTGATGTTVTLRRVLGDAG